MHTSAIEKAYRLIQSSNHGYSIYFEHFDLVNYNIVLYYSYNYILINILCSFYWAALSYKTKYNDYCFISIFLSPVPAPPPRCRQCPSYIDVFTSHSSHPTPPPYTCTITSNHVLCLCCLQPMPDRRSDSDVSIPPQKCMYNHYIYIYIYIYIHIYNSLK